MAIEILCLDEKFQPVGVLDDFSSLQWGRKYYGVPTVELHIDDEFWPLVVQSRYLYREDLEETMRIDGISLNESENNIVVSGQGLKVLLESRVVDTQTRLKGLAGEVMGDLVTKFCITPPERKIHLLEIGNAGATGTQIDTQITGGSVLEALEEIALEQEFSVRVRYDYDLNKMFFETWAGLDRRESQTVNSWATFSRDYENLSESAYSRTERNFKNFVYVAGAGEEKDRKIVTVDLSGGGNRYELYVDARDLQPKDSDGNEIPEADYLEMLKQRGREKLSEYRVEESIEGVVDVNSNLIYGKDFDLGDIVTFVDPNHGIVAERRIVEIMEVYETGGNRIDFSFGGDTLTFIQRIRRDIEK